MSAALSVLSGLPSSSRQLLLGAEPRHGLARFAGIVGSLRISASLLSSSARLRVPPYLYIPIHTYTYLHTYLHTYLYGLLHTQVEKIMPTHPPEGSLWRKQKLLLPALSDAELAAASSSSASSSHLALPLFCPTTRRSGSGGTGRSGSGSSNRSSSRWCCSR